MEKTDIVDIKNNHTNLVINFFLSKNVTTLAKPRVKKLGIFVYEDLNTLAYQKYKNHF